MLKASKKQVLVLVGCMLVACPLSLMSYYGNLLPYLGSYYHSRHDQISFHVDMLWPPSAFRCCFSLAMVFTSPMEMKFGIRPCMVAGLILLWVSQICPYFVVEEPLALTIIFGGAQGLATGILYPLALKLLVSTWTKHAGLATGVFSLGPIIGSLINIGLSFGVINPTNKKPDLELDNVVYFSDQDIIDKVPLYFLISGLATVAYTSLGLILAFIGSSNSCPSSRNNTRGEDQSSTPASQLNEQSVDAIVKPGNRNGVDSIVFTGVELIHFRLRSEQDKQTDQTRSDECETSCSPSDTSPNGQNIYSMMIADNKNGVVNSAFEGVELSQLGAESEVDKPKVDVERNGSVSPAQDVQTVMEGENQISPKGSKGGSKLLVLSELSPQEVLKTARFWVVWLCFIFLSHGNYVHLNLYKQYGQLAISDDSVLVTTGIIGMAGTLVVRPTLGAISDKIGVRQDCFVGRPLRRSGHGLYGDLPS